MKYANRVEEYEAIETLITANDAKIIFVESFHACGITSFIKEKIIGQLFTRDDFVIFTDLSGSSSLSSLLLEYLARSSLNKNLQAFIDTQLGDRKESLLTAIAQCIPYIGPLLGWVLEKKAALPIYSGSYSSAIEEILIPFLSSVLKNNKIILIIESIQDISDSSLSLFFRLLDLSGIRVIMVSTDTNDQVLKIKNALFIHEVKYCSVPFGRPEIKLVKELAALYGYNLEQSDAVTILNLSEKNIHKIIDTIIKYKTQTTEKAISQWERAFIAILIVFNVPITDVEIYSIAKGCALYSLSDNTECDRTLQDLREQRIICKENNTYCINSPYHPAVREVSESYTDMLFYQNAVYCFLKSNCNGLFLSELRYTLSKKLGCTSINDAHVYLVNLIVAGLAVQSNLLIEAGLRKRATQDCIIAAIALCRMRRYKEALAWITTIPEEKMNDEAQILRATLLNRTQQTGPAENELLMCIRKFTDADQQNLLGAFLISNYIHDEKLYEAKEIFKTIQEKHPDSPMEGYLLRNAASAYAENRAELYNRALTSFKNENDLFGYYTTLCNLGLSECIEGNYKAAIQTLLEAKHGLELFPSINQHVVYNNIGICCIYLNDLDSAMRHLQIALRFGQSGMPLLFATINLACVEAISGNYDSAIKLMENIKEEAYHSSIDRVKQKYLINRLFVEYSAGHINKLNSLISLAVKHPDRYHPEQTVMLTEYYRSCLRSSQNATLDWERLYSPCSLAYWYIDPLKLLAKSFIY